MKSNNITQFIVIYLFFLLSLFIGYFINEDFAGGARPDYELHKSAAKYFIDDFKIISIQIPCQTDVPVNISTSSITATEATVTWDAIPSATYDLRYRVLGSSTWIDVLDVITSSYTITSLQPTTTYEVEVRSKCDTATSAYSSTINFTTTDVNYCNSNGQSTADEYIGNVTLNTINNNSNAGITSTGYSDFTYITTDLDKNLTHNISISKIWTGTQYNEAVSV